MNNAYVWSVHIKAQAAIGSSVPWSMIRVPARRTKKPMTLANLNSLNFPFCLKHRCQRTQLGNGRTRWPNAYRVSEAERDPERYPHEPSPALGACQVAGRAPVQRG